MNSRGKAMTRWVLVLTGIGPLMAALDTLVVSTPLSRIRLDLGATVEQLEWTVNPCGRGEAGRGEAHVRGRELRR